MTLAKRHNIKVAYSNEAFELWYLLHFNFVTSGLSRNQYKEKLSKQLSFIYEKSNPKIYDILLSEQAVAIKNAKKLLKRYPKSDPFEDNPSTSVHLLVQELNKYTAS